MAMRQFELCSRLKSPPGRTLAAVLVCGAAFALAEQSAAQTTKSVPDFSSYWSRDGSDRGSYDPPPGAGPGPIMQDARYPRRRARPWNNENPTPGVEIPDDVVDVWVADLTNPILQPRTREQLAEIAAQELAGVPHVQMQTMCMAPGVPHILNLFEHMVVLQTPGEVVFLYSRNNHIRHIYLNQPHGDPNHHTWWGDSVGHYEGDTLVVDTHALLGDRDIDRYGTQHTAKLHVVERYRMSDDGRILEVLFTVEDQDAFTMPWSARADYRPNRNPWIETICPENAEREFWPGRPIYLPKDETPDF
jgi:hypothetical protein